MLRRSSGPYRSPSFFARLAPSRLTLTHGLMVISALLTFVAVSSVLQDRSATVEVLVARVAIEDGVLVRAESLSAIAVSAHHPLVDHLTTAVSFDEGLARRPIAAGEPVLRSDIVVAGRTVGGRTFAVPVDDRVIEGLTLRTGDRVDVVGTNTSGQIEVVAFDLKVARLPNNASAVGLAGSLGSSFVTVEVTPAEVLRLVAALRVDEVEIVRSTGAEPPATPRSADTARGEP